MTKNTVEQTRQSINFMKSEQIGTQGNVAGKFKQIDSILIAVIAVLTLGFITLLITVCGLAFTYMHDSQNMYQQSRDSTNIQNEKIDALIESAQNK